MPVPAESETNTTAPAAPTNATNEDPTSPAGVEDNGRASDGATPVGEASSDDKPLKLFVGGLSWQTSEDKLRECFEEYGEVTECSIMKDPVHKRSRGFGFVTFSDGESVERALLSHSDCPIAIDDKTIDPKIAIPPKRLSNKVKRIFVGGLSSDSTEEDLRGYFEDFGKVCETQLMYDRNTNRHRGFGFVTFESEAPAEKACSIQYHDIRGKKVEVKIAQTKEALAMQQGRGRMMAPARNFSYGYFGPSYQPYYNGQYPVDMLSMTGPYSASGPVMIEGNRPDRGSKTRSYSHYPAFGYGWGEHPRMSGYYPAGGYAGIPVHVMRAPIDSNMVPTSGVDYLSDHFQGMSLNGGYGVYGHAPQSPAAHFTPISVDQGGYANNSSYSPPDSLSPKNTNSTNGYNAQVPYVAGTQSSFAVAQPSY